MKPQLRQSCQACLKQANKYRSYQEVLDEWDRRKKKKCEKNFSLKIRQTKEQRSFNNSAVTLTQDLIRITAVVPLTTSIFSDKEVNTNFII